MIDKKELKELDFVDKGHHYELLYKGLYIFFKKEDSRLVCQYQTYTNKNGKSWFDLDLKIHSIQDLKEALKHCKKITDKMINHE